MSNHIDAVATLREIVAMYDADGIARVSTGEACTSYEFDALMTRAEKSLECADDQSAASNSVARIRMLEDALQFYANGDHFTLHDSNEWDTVSGEPENFYEDSANTATVEDGSIAKMVLAGTPIPDDDSEHERAATQPAGEVSASDKQAIEGFDQVMQERDHYHEMADKLAEQIAAITATDIGEHSSSNCPWESALQACDEYWALAAQKVAAPISEDTAPEHAALRDQWAEVDKEVGGKAMHVLAFDDGVNVGAARSAAPISEGDALPELPALRDTQFAYSADQMRTYVLADRAARTVNASIGLDAELQYLFRHAIPALNRYGLKSLAVEMQQFIDQWSARTQLAAVEPAEVSARGAMTKGVYK